MLKRTMLIRVAGMLATAAMVFSLAACKKTAETSSSTSKEKGKSQQQTGTEASTEIKWPKNVEIVVPAGAGGDTDFNSRLLAQKLSERLPANFVVSNVTGNSGATGSRQVKEAESDGGTVLFYHTAFLVNQASKTTDYGIEQYSFACIAAMSRGNVVTVRSDLGIQTLKELYEYTQSHPGELKMAAQTGATSYAIAMQMKRAGFDMNVVDAGGAADRLAAIVGGHVDVILAAYGSIKDYVNEGSLTALAMDGEEDLDVGDQGVHVEAIHNQGYEDIKLPFYYFFAFPKGTDKAMIKQFNDAVKDIVENDEDYQQKIYETYLQKPFYQGTEEGLKTFDDITEVLNKVDLSGKVAQ